jgi:undecaprenyl-diphosphatase
MSSRRDSSGIIARVTGVVADARRHISSRDRSELVVLIAALAFVALTLTVFALAGEVMEGDTQAFDERVLRSLRKAGNPAEPIGPAWLQSAALDVTALGSATVLGLTMLAVIGYLLLQGLPRMALFVFIASMGGSLLNSLLKTMFARPRPDVVPHLRDVMSLSFPSGHAMTSAAVYLTLGALLMRISSRRATRWYCMGVAALATFLVGLSRIYLGVHYPTDVLAGWIIGLSWALLCWIVERVLERRAVLARAGQQESKAS